MFDVHFLTLDNYEEPMNELKKGAIPYHIKDTIEGFLHDAELTKALNEDMKPNTVKFISAF